MTLDSLLNMLLIILGFGLLIGIHELGHFLAAKWAGIRTNAFAVGMGPQVVSFRKGVGFCYKSTKAKVIAKCGKDANDMSDADLLKHGISETEYSLRLLPIGGFVSMLGQEDGKPDEVSDDPRSYNKCPIGKRMVVVSAGVLMNLLLAIVFFLICFQIGVNFEAPVVGAIANGSPAETAKSVGDESYQKNHSLEVGDTVLSIDGKVVHTFQDVQIASAMAKPNVPIHLEARNAVSGVVSQYDIVPESGNQGGLLELGLYPSSSLTLRKGDEAEKALTMLQEQYEELNDLRPGMTMTAACESFIYEQEKEEAYQPVTQWGDFERIVSNTYSSIHTRWEDGETTKIVVIQTLPQLDILRPVGIPEDSPQNFEFGYMGLVPLSKIGFIFGSSPNVSVLQKGDVITRVAELEMPRMGQLRNFLATQPDGEMEMGVLRDGEERSFTVQLSKGKLGVLLTNALELPITANPIEEILVEVDGELVPSPTAIAGQQLLGGSTLLAVYDAGQGLVTTVPKQPIRDWRELRSRIEHERFSHVPPKGPVELLVQNPTTNAELTSIEFHHTGRRYSQSFNSPLDQQLFEPLYVSRSSGGNPLKALQMGFDETINMVVMTYLTIDRLVRRTVGVDQLRGPVGIIHIGSKIADRGMSYLLFFLAIISVNLAVLNFLPLPIVDGGLFLYLVYEKLFKKPPSLAFQNAAAMLGLGLIATLFIVTFYNDIARLVG
ncbi:MAG: site-2 protease family protein [Phycisphaerales bacterium]|nr:site-2 protease family protein [Planctomycetota bacterium]MBL6997868.1 site-2 protease family protein [Phycisphaerales bacterium]